MSYSAIQCLSDAEIPAVTGGCDASIADPDVIGDLSGCLTSPTAACTGLFADIVARSNLPYWGLPIPTPDDVRLVGWALSYGYLRNDLVPPGSPCSVVIGRDGKFYDKGANQAWRNWCATVCPPGSCTDVPVWVQHSQACADAALLLDGYRVRFEDWVVAAASRSGVILAERRLLPSGQWDVAGASWYAPRPWAPPHGLEYLQLAMGLGAPPGFMNAALSYFTAAGWLAQAQKGLLGPTRDWMLVYAPALTNLGR